MGPRAGLDGYGKSRPHRDTIPGPSSCGISVAIPTEIPQLMLRYVAGLLVIDVSEERGSMTGPRRERRHVLPEGRESITVRGIRPLILILCIIWG